MSKYPENTQKLQKQYKQKPLLYPLSFICYLFLGGPTSQIGQNDRYQLGLQLTPPRTSDTAVRVRDRQRRRRRRYLTPLQNAPDQGWTEPPGTSLSFYEAPLIRREWRTEAYSVVAYSVVRTWPLGMKTVLLIKLGSLLPCSARRDPGEQQHGELYLCI